MHMNKRFEMKTKNVAIFQELRFFMEGLKVIEGDLCFARTKLGKFDVSSNADWVLFAGETEGKKPTFLRLWPLLKKQTFCWNLRCFRNAFKICREIVEMPCRHNPLKTLPCLVVSRRKPQGFEEISRSRFLFRRSKFTESSSVRENFFFPNACEINSWSLNFVPWCLRNLTRKQINLGQIFFVWEEGAFWRKFLWKA